jgi:hypothetical protein
MLKTPTAIDGRDLGAGHGRTRPTPAASDAQLDAGAGQEHGIGPVVGLVLGEVDGVLPAPEQAAGTPVDLDGHPVTLGVLSDDEPVRVRGGSVGVDGGDLEGGRHHMSGAHAVLWGPRP